MNQASFPEFTGFGIDKRNLLEARMIITAYNQHVRLLSSEPFGCLRFQSLLGRPEPTLLWNHYAQNPSMSANAFHEKAGRSQVGSFVFSLSKVFLLPSRPVAMLPSALSRSDCFARCKLGVLVSAGAAT